MPLVLASPVCATACPAAKSGRGCIIWPCPPLAAAPAAFPATVSAVRDGDTLTVIEVSTASASDASTQHSFGVEARERLIDLVFGKTVTFEVVDRDEGGLEFSNLHVGGRPVSAEPVEVGMAWRYSRYDKQNEFGSLEDDARQHRPDLWADAHPVPPWEWKKARKERKAAR